MTETILYFQENSRLKTKQQEKQEWKKIQIESNTDAREENRGNGTKRQT